MWSAPLLTKICVITVVKIVVNLADQLLNQVAICYLYHSYINVKESVFFISECKLKKASCDTLAQSASCEVLLTKAN